MGYKIRITAYQNTKSDTAIWWILFFVLYYVVKDLFVIFLSVEVTCIVTEIGMLWTWLYLLLMVLCPVLWARFLLFGWVSCVQAELASFWWPQGLNPLNIVSVNNNNNEYLECLTCTGPKHFHILFTYILSKIQHVQHEHPPHTHAHTCTHTRTTHMHTHNTHAHTHHTPAQHTNVHAHTHGHISGQLNVKNPTPKTTELWKTTYWWYLGSSLLFLHSFHCTAAVHTCLLCYFNKWCWHCTVCWTWNYCIQVEYFHVQRSEIRTWNHCVWIE